jgi:phage repressor protein C with HTH and peptisase S24 domain
MPTKLDRASQMVDLLMKRYNLKTKKELAIKLGYPEKGSHINEIYGKRAFFNPDAILKVKELKGSETWLLTGEGQPFTDSYTLPNEPHTNRNNHVSERIVPVVIDENDKEYITYVPLPAQAGFAREYPQETYIKRLPHFSIPGYHNGNAVAFPVEGVSMTPTLYPGDIVICEPVERLEWIEAKDIHVIISDRGRQTKRLIYHKDKNSHDNSFLECISDNSYYNTELDLEQRKIPVQEVRYVFKVVMVISGNLPVPDETLKLIREILAKVDALARRDINLS